MATRHGRGHAARRNDARQVARSRRTHLGTWSDSAAGEPWPAPRWTHELCDHLHAENLRARSAAPAGRLVLPRHEPEGEAWGALALHRQREAAHRLACDAAQAQAAAAVERSVRKVRAKVGVWRQAEATPLFAWDRARRAAGDAVRGCALPPVPPGASLPLGPGSRTRLATLREQGRWPEDLPLGGF